MGACRRNSALKPARRPAGVHRPVMGCLRRAHENDGCPQPHASKALLACADMHRPHHWMAKGSTLMGHHSHASPRSSPEHAPRPLRQRPFAGQTDVSPKISISTFLGYIHMPPRAAASLRGHPPDHGGVVMRPIIFRVLRGGEVVLARWLARSTLGAEC